MYKTATKISYSLKKVIFVFIMCFISYSGFCQQTNVLKMPTELNSLRIGTKVDTASFKRVDPSELLSKRLSIYKIDYMYRGPQVSILDSVNVDSLLIGTNTAGVIQSIIISYKSNPFVFDDLVAVLGSNYGEFTVSEKSSSQKTYCWVTENNYRVSLKPSINSNDAILVLSDGNYYHLFKRTLINNGSQIDY